MYKRQLAGSPSPPRPPPAKPQLEGPTEAELFASGFTEDVIDCCFLSADDVRARLEVQRTKRVSIGGDRTVDYGAVYCGECNVVSLPTGSSGSAVASRSANALVAVERR